MENELKIVGQSDIKTEELSVEDYFLRYKRSNYKSHIKKETGLLLAIEGLEPGVNYTVVFDDNQNWIEISSEELSCIYQELREHPENHKIIINTANSRIAYLDLSKVLYIEKI